MNENLRVMDLLRKELQASQLAKLDDKKLLLLFHQQTWTRMSKNERLRALQEIENRYAKADGRSPVKVSTRPMEPNTLGIHGHLPDGGEIIYVNPRFLENGKLSRRSTMSIHSAAGALNTVLHEGRHSYQFNAILGKIKNVPVQQRLEWMAVTGRFGGMYEDDDPLFYALQSIEMDARRFARRSLAKVNDYFNSIGMKDRNFSNQTAMDLQRETRLICQVRLYLDHQKLDLYEQKVIAYFMFRNPGIDIRGIRLFDHARFILDHPEINNPLKMLQELDKLADAKLGLCDYNDINRVRNGRLNSLKVTSR